MNQQFLEATKNILIGTPSCVSLINRRTPISDCPARWVLTVSFALSRRECHILNLCDQGLLVIVLSLTSFLFTLGNSTCVWKVPYCQGSYSLSMMDSHTEPLIVVTSIHLRSSLFVKAARRGDDTAVARLLNEGHDPTVSIGKTAYAVATEKSVRDAFRRHMANFPDQWDWTTAGVPSPLTAEMEAEQQAKEVNYLFKLI